MGFVHLIIPSLSCKLKLVEGPMEGLLVRRFNQAGK